MFIKEKPQTIGQMSKHQQQSPFKMSWKWIFPPHGSITFFFPFKYGDRWTIFIRQALGRRREINFYSFYGEGRRNCCNEALSVREEKSRERFNEEILKLIQIAANANPPPAMNFVLILSSRFNRKLLDARVTFSFARADFFVLVSRSTPSRKSDINE